MPLFLDTRGYSDIAIFICDRCKMKRPHATAQRDFNFPGLLVCQEGCQDEKDPYRLPARQTERITIRYPRPDVNVAVDPDAIITTGNDQWELSPEQNTQVPEDNGNLDTLSPSPGQ
jgi:hypothetical protein